MQWSLDNRPVAAAALSRSAKEACPGVALIVPPRFRLIYCKLHLRAANFVSRPWRETLRSVLPYVFALSRPAQPATGLKIELDDHLLADIGVSREEAFLEAQKLFWE